MWFALDLLTTVGIKSNLLATHSPEVDPSVSEESTKA